MLRIFYRVFKTASITWSDVFKAITTGNALPIVKTPAWLANLAFHTVFTMFIRLFNGLLINILVNGIMTEKGILYVMLLTYIRHYKELNLNKSPEMSKKNATCEVRTHASEDNAS